MAEVSAERLDAAVDAYYAATLTIARDSIAATKFDAGQLVDLFRKLRHESETAQVLISASFVEDRVQELLSLQMTDVGTTQKRDSVFGSNGPLASFGNRLTLAYQLGWLSERVYKNIQSFRKVRNEFAHRAFETSYADPKIAGWMTPLLAELERFERTSVVAARQAKPGSEAIRRLEEMPDKDKFLAAIALTTGATLRELLARPFAQKHQVDPSDLLGSASDQPAELKNLAKDWIRSVLEVFARDPAM